ncbi:uncharacterized protein LOC134221954 [Armigeres subalbatus]|uniref:uncharacterized protein LOC134221954 n=1 Tax=Armigeres subalbatus TaxID=124917 RepID=UPI002ED1A886
MVNATQKSSNGLSLNNLLATGPIVQDTLYNLLINFRLHAVIITEDTEKMYLQIRVTEDDSKLIRMLWQEPEQPLAECGINTVTFAEDEGHEFPLAKDAIDNFYVDDLLSGAATREEAIEKRRQLSAMLQRGGFVIRKWASNDKEVLAEIPPEDQAVNPVHTVDCQDTIKTLGIQWQYREDLLAFKTACDPIKEYFTKLSTIAKIFDPLGLIGLVVVIAKMLMQELWKIKVDWSEPLPNQFNHRWRTYLM